MLRNKCCYKWFLLLWANHLCRCPNPDLSSAKTSFLRVLDLPQTPHQRRFMVTAFQFMNVTTQKYINEEVVYH